MKKKLLFGLALATALVGCKQSTFDAEPATPETNEIQAYIYANTSDITIKPATETSVLVVWAEGMYESEEKEFPIVIGRRVSNVAASLVLDIEDEDGVFDYDETLIYTKDATSDTLWVTTSLDFGESAELKITIPDKYSTSYGTKTITVKVNVDYTWLPAGSVTMSSQWEGTTAAVAIEKAKEFSNADGNILYRLVSPYYYLAPDYCTEEGYHLNFLLDKDYNAVDLVGGTWIQVENTGYNWIYWDPEKYGDEDYFVNSANQYVISCLWSDGDYLYGPYIESFVWDKGYPGTLVDPEEGDGELDELIFTSASYEMALDEYGDPVTVDEVLDPVLYAADKYVFPESYIGHYIYYVTLEGVNGTMTLELVADELEDEYTFGAYTVDGENLLGVAGKAYPGYWDGANNNGCYLQTALSKYFLQGGTITITDESTTIDVVSATGAKIKGSFTGKIEEAGEPVTGRKAKRLFNK